MALVNDSHHTVVFYHDNCLDGFASAYIAYRELRDTASYIPINYGDTEWDVLNTVFPSATRYNANIKEVYFLDFCPTEAGLDIVLNRAHPTCKVTILDHHIGQADLMARHNQILDVTAVYVPDKSGVGLTWNHFFPNTRMPNILAAVQDRDLWNFKLPDTKAICTALYCKGLNPWEFEHWNYMIAGAPETYRDILSQQGGILLAYLSERYTAHADKAAPIILWFRNDDGYPESVTGLAVNAPYEYASEIGHILAERCGTFGLVWSFDAIKGDAQCSIRGVDVLPIAKYYGGGGHKAAAGFRLPLAKLVYLLLEQPTQ